VLSHQIDLLRNRARMLLYAPHSFAYEGADKFGWIPAWQELSRLSYAKPGIRVLDFNPGVDRNGFFHMIIERRAAASDRTGETDNAPVIRRGHYFYAKAGIGRSQGHGTRVLSAAGLRVLRQLIPDVSEHHFLCDVPTEVAVNAGDVCMGHYGPWITAARARGGLVLLFGPGDRFRKERHDGSLFVDLQKRGTFHEQYASSHMAVMHAGGLWRMLDPWMYEGLCRWMDLPVEPSVFPRSKPRISPPGKRVFCFVGLYDDHQKGAERAKSICEACPDTAFIAIGCKPFGVRNCQEFPAVDNRSARFRSLVTRADFIVQPGIDDCQPGPPAECGSLGLLPIVSEHSGYVLSFPRRIDVNDLQQCAATIHDAQWAGEVEVSGWQALNAQYIEEFHRPAHFEQLVRNYVQEAVADAAAQPPANLQKTSPFWSQALMKPVGSV
jgi:hypothetical protein